MGALAWEQNRGNKSEDWAIFPQLHYKDLSTGGNFRKRDIHFLLFLVFFWLQVEHPLQGHINISNTEQDQGVEHCRQNRERNIFIHICGVSNVEMYCIQYKSQFNTFRVVKYFTVYFVRNSAEVVELKQMPQFLPKYLVVFVITVNHCYFFIICTVQVSFYYAFIKKMNVTVNNTLNICRAYTSLSLLLIIRRHSFYCIKMYETATPPHWQFQTASRHR